MDKTVMFAVAGSGKTTFILKQLCLQKKALLITYTINNLENLRNGIISKWGYIPNNIKVMSYYTFIYNYCYKPILSYTVEANGINWNPNPNTYAKMSDPGYFIDGSNRLYSNRIAKLFEYHNAQKLINQRLEKYFDIIYIDEVQDFGGHDFNFLKNIAKANISLLFVGDFSQHTYDTSHDRGVNKTLHDDYDKYQQQFKSMGVKVDTKTLIRSHRCNPKICEFISDKLGITMESNKKGVSKIYIIKDEEVATTLFHHTFIVKLFYQDRHKYPCFSRNWGETKGEDKYNHVCVVLNDSTWKKYIIDDLKSLAPRTKNKLYVACTRTKGHLFLLPESLVKKFKQA